MNLHNLINDTLNDFEKGTISISLITQKSMRIARLSNDYKSYARLKLETMPQTNSLEMTNLRNSLLESYDDKQIGEDAWTRITRDYIHGRRISDTTRKENILGLPLADIEEIIKITKDRMKANILPEGMHTLDLYFEKQKKDKLDLLYSKKLETYQSILNNVAHYVYSFLTEKESETMNKEAAESATTIVTKNVFIIHGHNEAKARELFGIIKDFGLNPYILSDLPNIGASTIIEKFEIYAEQCSFAFAVFTPDDIVENGGRKYVQARPNVLYELGWFVARLGRNNVSVLLKNGEGMEIFSDFQGVMQNRFYDNISEQYIKIKQDLEYAGLI